MAAAQIAVRRPSGRRWGRQEATPTASHQATVPLLITTTKAALRRQPKPSASSPIAATFITDVGRLLLRVSKATTSDVFETRDELWECLCWIWWYEENDDDDDHDDDDDIGVVDDDTQLSRLAQAADVKRTGWERLFRNYRNLPEYRTAVEETKDAPPLKYRREDYTFIVSIFDYSKVDGESIPIGIRYLEGRDALRIVDGDRRWMDIGGPIELFEFEGDLEFEEFNEDVVAEHVLERMEDFRIILHALRKSDGKRLLLSDSDGYSENRDIEDYDNDYDDCPHFFENSSATQQIFGYDDCTMHYLSHHDLFNKSDSAYHHVRGPSFQARPNIYCTAKETGDEGEDGPMKRFVLEEICFYFVLYPDGATILQDDFDDLKSARPGLAVAHFLERVDGWS